MRARAHRILIPFAAFLAILPMLLSGPSCGHDFDFHLLSWLEAATQFAHLHYPRWAYTPAYNAGEPRFLFYPPLSWSLGAALGLILPWKLVPATFTWVALTLSGFTMHAFARRHTPAGAATFAAIFYLLNPYMLFTAYERTAYGELLAAAWLPLLLAAALAPRVRMVALAIPIALLWLTNAPAAVMSCYALAFLAIVRLAEPRSPSPQPRRRIAFATLAGTFLGLGVAGFYLVPAIAERPQIQSGMATIEGMRIADNTLFHHMSPATEDNLAHDTVLHTASLIAVTLLAGIALTLLARTRTPPSSLVPLAWLSLFLAFLLTPYSMPVWNHLPELRFLQFPWRLTAILGAILGLFAAVAFERLVTRPSIAHSLLPLPLFLLILPCWRLFHQPCDPEDTVAARVALYHSSGGTEPTDEYTPTAADNDALAKTDPPYWLAGNPNAAPPAAPPGQAPTRLDIHLKEPQFLILNRRGYPLWQVLTDGTPARPAADPREDGLIAVRLPAGHSTVELQQRTPLDFLLGLILTALAVLATLILLRHRPEPV